MPRSARAVLSLCLLGASGCIGTRMVNLGNLEAPLPAADASAPWQADMNALLARYEAAPVLAPGDERLEPVFGGLSTLTYFGADFSQKALDQEISAQWRAPGARVEDACAAADAGSAPGIAPTGPEADASSLRASGDRPPFTPVWIPVSVSGGAAPDGARCDALGQPLEAKRFGHFCMFGRLALQPTGRRPLVVVLHGLFDSGAQDYVQRIGAVLYGLGHSVLLPDMRDHGDTFRAAPQIATTLGTLEGADVLALVHAVRAACGARVSSAGVVGVSGGGLDAIRAFTEDRQRALEMGAVAISPLLDVAAAMHDVGQRGSCALTRAVELTWVDEAVLAGSTAAAFLGGAVLVQGLEGDRVDSKAAIAAGVGAGVGLLSGLLVDAFFDGSSSHCVAQQAVAGLFGDMLRARWRTLRARSDPQTISPAGQRIEPEAVTLEDYVRERVRFLAARSGLSLRQLDSRSLADDLHRSLAAGGPAGARLLVIGADDDPVTRATALRAFAARTSGMREVYVHSVHHGGHGAMWVVQPAIMQRLFERFFGDRTRDPPITNP